VQVAGAGEWFGQGRMEASLGRCGCCTLVLHGLPPRTNEDHQAGHDHLVSYLRSITSHSTARSVTSYGPVWSLATSAGVRVTVRPEPGAGGRGWRSCVPG